LNEETWQGITICCSVIEQSKSGFACHVSWYQVSKYSRCNCQSKLSQRDQSHACSSPVCIKDFLDRWLHKDREKMSTGWLRMKGLTFARRYLNIIRCVSLLEKTPHKDPKQARGGGGGGGDHLARSSLNVHGCVCVCISFLMLFQWLRLFARLRVCVSVLLARILWHRSLCFSFFLTNSFFRVIKKEERNYSMKNKKGYKLSTL
jgi:hypothetical protein